jgi:hypothetical protein
MGAPQPDPSRRSLLLGAAALALGGAPLLSGTARADAPSAGDITGSVRTSTKPRRGLALTPAMLPKRGINLFPWFSLTRDRPPPAVDYDWPPYQIGRPVPTQRDLDQINACGFDHVRIPVDPGPFLAASTARRAQLLSDLARAVDACLATGLNVVVANLPNTATHHWNPARFVEGVAAPAFLALSDLLADIARDLNRRPADKVALELFNEPPLECGSLLWPELQRRLHTAVRRVAPGLTLVVTGACGSLPAGLADFDLDGLADANTLATIHFYEPYVFTHQGAVWADPPALRHLAGMPWPGDPARARAALGPALARLDGDLSIDSAERARRRADLERMIREYAEGNPSTDYLMPFLEQIRAFKTRHRLHASRIYVGEFGVVRTQFDGQAAEPADRRRWTRQVRELIEAEGFGWAYWNYFDRMGLVIDDRGRQLDGELVSALGLSAPRGPSRSEAPPLVPRARTKPKPKTRP